MCEDLLLSGLSFEEQKEEEEAATGFHVLTGNLHEDKKCEYEFFAGLGN